MKIYRALSTLIPLVMMTSQAVAAEEVCLDGDTVVGIKDLSVNTNYYGRINIDVDFKYKTGYEIYGSQLDLFPFPQNTGDSDEDAFSVVLAIDTVLNANNPTPDSAGQSDQDDFYIGASKAEAPAVGEITARGAQAVIDDDGSVSWQPCRSDHDCEANSFIDLNADERVTWGVLSKADGLGCGDAPQTSFPITPGMTGNWFDPARNGEGFLIEIIGNTLAPQLLAYFFTYDDSGNQMWLSGIADVDGDTAVVPMTVTSGTVFGPGFDPDDVIREDWGTITFMFDSCIAGSAEYVSNDFGSGVFDTIRLTSVSGSTCP